MLLERLYSDYRARDKKAGAVEAAVTRSGNVFKRTNRNSAVGLNCLMLRPTSPGSGPSLDYESFGLSLRVSANTPEILKRLDERLHKMLPDGFLPSPKARASNYSFNVDRASDTYQLTKAGERILSSPSLDRILEAFESGVRITIAEFAPNRVFVHAGAVGWRGKAIVLPARSFCGKTTLVSELVKLGATYLSDEFAVLDEDGMVHPFAKPLSMRRPGEGFAQTDISVQHIGGAAQTTPLPVGLVLLTQYTSTGKWRPRVLSHGRGVMAVMEHTIPVRADPTFALRVLSRLSPTAPVVKSMRRDAREFAPILLRYAETIY